MPLAEADGAGADGPGRRRAADPRLRLPGRHPAAAGAARTCRRSSGPAGTSAGPSATSRAWPSSWTTRPCCPRPSPSRPRTATAGSSSSATGSTAGSGDLAPLWPDDVLVAAIDGRARGRRPGHRARLRHGRAARPDPRRDRLHRARHRADRRPDRRDGPPRHRARPHADQHRHLPGHRGRRATGSRPTPRTCASCTRGPAASCGGPPRPACRSTRARTPAAASAHGRIADEIAALHAAGLPALDALGAASWAAREWLGRPALDLGRAGRPGRLPGRPAGGPGRAASSRRWSLLRGRVVDRRCLANRDREAGRPAGDHRALCARSR